MRAYLALILILILAPATYASSLTETSGDERHYIRVTQDANGDLVSPIKSATESQSENVETCNGVKITENGKTTCAPRRASNSIFMPAATESHLRVNYDPDSAGAK